MRVKLVDPKGKDVDEVCAGLLEKNLDWIKLDKDTLKDVADKVLYLKEDLSGKTFLVPGYMVDARTHQSKVNRLLAYMTTQGKAKGWNFVIVASDPKRIDWRIRTHLKE